MNETPTPRTDAAEKHAYEFDDDMTPVVESNIVRQLERELSRAWKLAEDNGKLAHQTACELVEAREERDTLAEALRQVRAICLDKSIETHPDEHTKGTIDECIDIAESAPAAAKGGTH